MDDEKFKNSRGAVRGDVGEKFESKRSIADPDYKKRPDLEKKHEPVDNAEMAGD